MMNVPHDVWPDANEVTRRTSTAARKTLRMGTSVKRLLRIDAVQHAWIRNRFTKVRHAADPGHDALDAHAEAGVRKGAVLARVEVPLEGRSGELVLLDALQQQGVVVDALPPADDLAVTLGGDHVH